MVVILDTQLQADITRQAEEELEAERLYLKEYAEEEPICE